MPLNFSVVIHVKLKFVTSEERRGVVDLIAVWRGVVSLAFQSLYDPEKGPLNRRINGPKSWSGLCGEEKNLCLYRESNFGRPATLLIFYFIGIFQGYDKIYVKYFHHLFCSLFMK
jgi:hypothetical protein